MTTNKDTPKWCPEQQIYIGGKLPEDEQVEALLADSTDGSLRLFGYGSLCWNPGTGALAKPGVIDKLGRSRGYKRCWAQRSTDHRGNPKFPGIVCTLLEDREVYDIQRLASDNVPLIDKPTMAEGVIYWIPPELVEECLEELDFREKGGYAREVIEVVEDETGDLHKALLYRGTPDNPAFWNRALLDLPFAAAIMSVSQGPSGPNDFYLNSLDEFLETTHTIGTKNDDTTTLASMTKYFQQNSSLYFLYGSGSNQHNQLLLKRPNNAACLINGEDAHESKEIVLCAHRHDELDPPKEIYAGGGHSGLLTKSGRLFLWGWNEDGQCGTSGTTDDPSPLPTAKPLSDLVVETAALGFSHTLIIEKETQKLFAFGNNERGQVNGKPSKLETLPQTPGYLANEKILTMSAGLFHSAIIIQEGELITFGCSRSGQSLLPSSSADKSQQVPFRRWKVADGIKLVDVACGRRHTIAVDKLGRVWSFGDNKYGQLGRKIEGKKDSYPALVDGLEDVIPIGSSVRVVCGWSHTIIQVQKANESVLEYYGWGRNDKGQLGLGTNDISVPQPNRLFQEHKISRIACGSESTLVIEEDTNIIMGCGWNEHGNLATCNQNDQLSLTRTLGAKVVGPPGLHEGKVVIAAGGAHYFATKIIL